MIRPLRALLVLSILAVVLAACGTGATSSASPQPSQPSQPSTPPSVQPSAAPSDAPAHEEREVAGTITVAEMAFSGPGATVQEAIDAGDSADLPNLVNGVLFRDTDGRIYLATAVSDASAPVFEGPMLEVLEMAADGPEFDMANADALGLEEANGIVFKPEAQVLGFVDVP